MKLFAHKSTRSLGFLTSVLTVAVLAACNMGSTANNTPTLAQIIPPTVAKSTDTPGSTPITHTVTPVAIIPGPVSIANDQNTQLSANLHWATSGDLFDLNRFERPFTQNGMDYLPALDIQTLRISKYPNWYLASLQLAGVDQTSNSLNADYGLEIDLNKDGRGDVLIWTHPPYTTDWSVAPVMVYTDKDGDVGGPNPLKPDAPFSGDGYETVIFNGGQGADPDLVWVRIAPDSPKTIEFAFKPSLLNGTTAFLIGGWADADIKDPSKFNYNDHFTLADAGSAMHGDPNYPVKALYALDSTCRAAVGFTETGTEPLVCPLVPTPSPTPGSGSPATAVPPPPRQIP